MEGIANTIAKLKENIRNHMNPYNVGDEGETTKLINELIRHIEQPRYGAGWVKDRLPSKAGDYYCKCKVDGDTKRLIVEFDKNGRWGEAPNYDYYENFEILEWLESGTAEGREEDAVAFAEWLYENRWFRFENGRWEYTFEMGSSVSKGEYLKNYVKTTAKLYELFKQQKEKP